MIFSISRLHAASIAACAAFLAEFTALSTNFVFLRKVVPLLTDLAINALG